MGGTPNQGTPADRRLAANKPKAKAKPKPKAKAKAKVPGKAFPGAAKPFGSK